MGKLSNYVNAGVCIAIAAFAATQTIANAQDLTSPKTTSSSSPQTLQPGTPKGAAFLPPLDAHGKAIYWWRHTTGYGVLAGGLVAAGINQINGTPPEWTGAEGFGKRLGDVLGTTAIAGTVSFALSEALHVDPRYYRCTGCGFGGHLGSAIKQTFLVRTDGGHYIPAIPEVAGIYGASMTSMMWYPDRYNPLTDGVRRANYIMLYRFGLDLFREIAPDKARKLFRVTTNDKYDDQ